MAKAMTDYAGAEITPTMAAFADWVIAEVFGGKLPKGVDEASLRRGIAIGGSTRGYFQASDSWKSDPRNPVLSREAKAAEREAAKLEAARKAAAKVADRIAKAEAALAALKASAEPTATEDAA